MTPSVTAQNDASDGKTNAHGEETRLALVRAAIDLIAKSGLEGASLRAINVAAGCRNSSAAHYHFGNKTAMIEAAIDYVLAEVRNGQDPLLASLEARAREGRSVGVREILEASYLPYLALMTRPGFGPTAVKFVSRLLVESDEQLQAVVNRNVAPMLERCLALGKSALPHVPDEALKLRILITVTNVIHGAGDFGAIQHSPFGDLSGGNPLAVLHTMFDYMDAAVSAPPTPLTAADEARMAATLFPQA